MEKLPFLLNPKELHSRPFFLGGEMTILDPCSLSTVDATERSGMHKGLK